MGWQKAAAFTVALALALAVAVAAEVAFCATLWHMAN